jgi:hypothetical protein
MWLTVVVRNRTSTREYVVTVNNVTGYVRILSTSVTDRPVSRTWIDKGQDNEAYLNGDMAGVFVLDEYLFYHCEYETKLNCSHERETDKESVRKKTIDRETNLTSIFFKKNSFFTVCLPPIWYVAI